MTDNTIEAFVNALLDDQPPEHFRASSDEIDILRVALELRASQAQFARADPQFIEELHRRLAVTTTEGAELIPIPASGGPGSSPDRRRAQDGTGSGRKLRRRFSFVGNAAAAIVLVAATFAAASVVDGHSRGPVAQLPTSAPTVRSGVLLTADGRPLGYTYAYSGKPSWVFMDVQGASLSGTYTCELQLADGTTVPAGLVAVYNGAGDWAHTVGVQVNQLRHATLVSSAGVTVASATFS